MVHEAIWRLLPQHAPTRILCSSSHPCAGAIPLPDGSSQQLLSEAEAALVQRFDPSAELDTIGFFIAKFVKRAKA